MKRQKQSSRNYFNFKLRRNEIILFLNAKIKKIELDVVDEIRAGEASAVVADGNLHVETVVVARVQSAGAACSCAGDLVATFAMTEAVEMHSTDVSSHLETYI